MEEKKNDVKHVIIETHKKNQPVILITMQECAICYDVQETQPLFFNCVVCKEGKCCFKCYDRLQTPKCPVCQTQIKSVIHGMHMFFFINYQFGVHEKNAKLLSIINQYSPLVAYLKENLLAFERSEENTEETTVDEADTIQYDEYFDIVNKEFPDCPFDVSLNYKTLLRLDEPFCDDDPEMIIYVTHACCVIHLDFTKTLKTTKMLPTVRLKSTNSTTTVRLHCAKSLLK